MVKKRVGPQVPKLNYGPLRKAAKNSCYHWSHIYKL